MHIDKHAPVGAGLGGGSADAGAALRLANATLPEPLAAGRAGALAAEVGSDVPFFASGLDAALARGRGEQLEPLELHAPAWVVAGLAGRGARHGRGVRGATGRRPARRERVEALQAGPFAAADCRQLAALVENDLGPPAEQLCPPTAALREQLLACGALAASVSGSGSAVFGLFSEAAGAQAAGEQVARRAPWTLVTRLCSWCRWR